MRAGSRAAFQLAVVGALTAGAWIYASRVVVFPPWHHTFDLRVYRGAVQWWLDHHRLYAFLRPHTSKGFTYPPFAVLVLLPLAIGTETTATVLLTGVSAVLVVLTTWWLVAPVARRHGWSPWFAVAVAVPVVAAMEPVRETLGWGQVNMVLVALVLADVGALRRGRPWAGAGIGLATAIKLTPGLFVVYLALTGRRRATAVAAGTFLAASLLAFAVDPPSSVQFWTSSLWRTGRVGSPDRTSDQSVLGLLARLGDPGAPDRRAWVLLCAVLLVLGLWRAARAARRGDELTGVTLTGLTTCLVSPISWTHHLYWVIPAAVVLVDVAAGTPLHPSAPSWFRSHARGVAGTAAAVVVVAFAGSVIWFFDYHPGSQAGHGLVGFAGQNAYLLIMVALLALLPVREIRGPKWPQWPLRDAPFAARTTAPPRPGGSSPR